VLGLIAWPLDAKRARWSPLWRDSSIAGLLLFSGYAFQTAGLTTTGASNSALITGLFVVITPFLAAVFNRRLPPPILLFGALVAFGGVYLLTAQSGSRFVTGDLLTIGAAFSFAGHILVLSRFARRHPVVLFTACQLLATAAVALPMAMWLEGLPLPGSREVPALLLTAIGVSAGAYLLQTWAQKVISPSFTGILLALEPAFAVATAAVVLDERLSIRGWIGAVLILGAILLVILRGDESEDDATRVSAAIADRGE
jgi:drug/metabolite transporter (DMT)-like permease